MSQLEASQFKSRFVSLIIGGQGFPKKHLDRHILFISATLGLEPQRQYTEGELNDELRAWTARFGDSVHLDHVTLRRFLVDEGYLGRDSAGKSYELTTTDWPYTFDPSIKTLDLEALVNEARAARELKKQQYLGKSSGS
jgi:hypothetical protein